jgi:signal transduction histidine kinase
MPIDKWPCKPESFASILPGDLPYFLQTGTTHALGRPISIIDPQEAKRFDPISRFDSYEPFCRCLRGGDDDQPINWDAKCLACDLQAARHLISERCQPQTLVRYRCYMGLEEAATIITVGGLSVMVISGQFRPPEGVGDIQTAISCLGKRRPRQSEVSPAMWESISRFDYLDDLWLSQTPSNEVRSKLFFYADELQVMKDDFAPKFLEEVRRIVEIAQNYYEMAKAKVEANISKKLDETAAKVMPYDREKLWKGVDNALEVLRSSLDIEYAAFFSGENETDTVLTLKASAGPALQVERGENFPHFNWRKAEIRSQYSDFQTSTLDWDKLIVDRKRIDKGFRGGSGLFSDCAGLIPAMLRGGPFGLLVLGPQLAGAQLEEHAEFVLTVCRDLATRILTLQLSQILQVDRLDWKRTSQLTGHRVRASIQNINSQLKTIKDERDGQPGFTTKDREAAEKDLEIAFQDLKEISYAAESSVRGAIDVKSANREFVPLGQIVWAAVETQQDLVEKERIGVEIEVSDGIAGLPVVLGNQILLRFMFINLINNAIKYSYPRPDDRMRIVNVKPPRDLPDPGEVSVEITNFGLGIKQADLEKIFEWGVRLTEGQYTFKEVYGKGIGLWEAKHIVEGHGGKLYVRSIHFSKAPVTDQNIEQCITVFTVSLPIGGNTHKFKGG